MFWKNFGVYAIRAGSQGTSKIRSQNTLEAAAPVARGSNKTLPPMKNDPASPPSVARWPFYLGDIVLLGLACLAILYGGVPLPTPNIVIAVVCALAGIGLLVAPYLLEFDTKLKIAQEAAKSAADSQAKRLGHAAEQLSNVISRSQSTEEQAGQALGSLEDLSEKLAAQIEELTQVLARDGSPSADDPIGEISSLLQARDQQIKGLATKLSGVEKALIELADRESPAPAKPADSQAPPVAVSVPEAPKEKFDPPVPEKKETKRSPEPANAAVMEAPAPAKPPPAEKKAPKTKKSRVTIRQPEPELELFSERAASKTKSNGNNERVTTLVATAYIGIGNKLYLRGDGPGLSWDKGALMEFLAIGKWGWKTAEASAPVNCKIYRNDEAPMLDENIVIDPGERIEIAPRF